MGKMSELGDLSFPYILRGGKEFIGGFFLVPPPSYGEKRTTGDESRESRSSNVLLGMGEGEIEVCRPSQKEGEVGLLESSREIRGSLGEGEDSSKTTN